MSALARVEMEGADLLSVSPSVISLLLSSLPSSLTDYRPVGRWASLAPMVIGANRDDSA